MRPLPGAPFVAREQTELRIEGHSLADLGRRFGTPLFVYSRTAMRSAFESYEHALRGHKHLVCYAMKANSSLAVLQTFAQAGAGFDIVSGGELVRVLAAGGDPSRVVFSGVGKTRAEMRQGLLAGVRCFNVESDAEIDRL
ncbi:MAG TPA: diaminopimelate decarboxylase, partial [Rubrivivax sp.]|nr:diaminopimelate decarboxylase [Rubrivivax sp.]